MEFLFAKELFTYCKYVLFVHMIPKVPTEIYFGIGMVNTKKYQPIPTGKYQFSIQLYKLQGYGGWHKHATLDCGSGLSGCLFF